MKSWTRTLAFFRFARYIILGVDTGTTLRVFQSLMLLWCMHFLEGLLIPSTIFRL